MSGKGGAPWGAAGEICSGDGERSGSRRLPPFHPTSADARSGDEYLRQPQPYPRQLPTSCSFRNPGGAVAACSDGGSASPGDGAGGGSHHDPGTPTRSRPSGRTAAAAYTPPSPLPHSHPHPIHQHQHHTSQSAAAAAVLPSRWRLWPLVAASLLAVVLLQALLWRRTRELGELRSDVAGAVMAALQAQHAVLEAAPPKMQVSLERSMTQAGQQQQQRQQQQETVSASSRLQQQQQLLQQVTPHLDGQQQYPQQRDDGAQAIRDPRRSGSYGNEVGRPQVAAAGTTGREDRLPAMRMPPAAEATAAAPAMTTPKPSAVSTDIDRGGSSNLPYRNMDGDDKSTAAAAAALPRCRSSAGGRTVTTSEAAIANAVAAVGIGPTSASVAPSTTRVTPARGTPPCLPPPPPARVTVQLPPRLILNTFCQSAAALTLAGGGGGGGVPAVPGTAAEPSSPPEGMAAAVRWLCAQAARAVLGEAVVGGAVAAAKAGERGADEAGVGGIAGGSGGFDGGGPQPQPQRLGAVFPWASSTSGRRELGRGPSQDQGRERNEQQQTRCSDDLSGPGRAFGSVRDGGSGRGNRFVSRGGGGTGESRATPAGDGAASGGGAGIASFDEGGNGGGGGPSSGGPSIFVGIFTSHNPGGLPAADRKYDYALRRAVVRSTWLGHYLRRMGTPNPTAGGTAADGGDSGRTQQSEVVVRFVAGEVPNDPAAEAALEREAAAHGDFMRLRGPTEYYSCLPNKTRAFFREVLAAHPRVRWIVKADDDVYLIPQRLPAAVVQWERIGAGYIGCMKHGGVITEAGARWHEPQHLLLGSTYYLHAYGSAYVLSAETVRRVILRNYDHLRLLANEDTSVGIWMLAQDVVFFEDMRLCSMECHTSALAVWTTWCAGLCAPLEDMVKMHRNATCTAPHADSLPYMPSYPDHVAFERLWV